MKKKRIHDSRSQYEREKVLASIHVAEAEKKKKSRNEYMENFWKNMEEITKKKSIPCVFGCGNMSMPGSDLCQECQDNYNIYYNINDE